MNNTTAIRELVLQAQFSVLLNVHTFYGGRNFVWIKIQPFKYDHSELSVDGMKARQCLFKVCWNGLFTSMAFMNFRGKYEFKNAKHEMVRISHMKECLLLARVKLQVTYYSWRIKAQHASTR